MNIILINILLIVSSILFAVTIIINRYIFKDVNPIHFIILSSVILGLICLPFLFFIDYNIIKTHSKYLVIWPLLNIIANIMFFYCIGHNKNGTAATVCIQNILIIIIVFVISFYLFEENLDNKQVIGIIFGAISLFLLS